MTDDWVEVSNCAWVHHALFVKSVLDAAGIEAVVPDEHTANLQPFYVPALGGVRVLVRASDQDAAREVLSSPAPTGRRFATPRRSWPRSRGRVSGASISAR